MAIATVQTTVEQGLSVGSSKTINQLVADGDWKLSELVKFSWSSFQDPYIKCAAATTVNTATSQGAAVAYNYSYVQGTLSAPSRKNRFVYNPGRITQNDGMYCFNILLYGRYPELYISSDNASNYRVITDIDLSKCYFKHNSHDVYPDYTYNYPESGTLHNIPRLTPDESGLFNTITNLQMQWVTPYTVVVIDEDTFFVVKMFGAPGQFPQQLNTGSIGNTFMPIQRFNGMEGGVISMDTWYYEYGTIQNYNKSKRLLRWVNNDNIANWYDGDWGTSSPLTQYNNITDDLGLFITKRYNSSGGYANLNYWWIYRTETALMNVIALTGLKWVFISGDDKNYKPIIDDTGLITGYTTNPDVPSKIDTITNVTGNNISPTPPTPPGPAPGPYEDDPWNGVTFAGVGLGGGGAFARCYYMTSTELANLRTWMSGVGVPEGFNPMAQIIALSQVPVALSGDAPETVQFINSSAVYDPGVTSRVVDSGVSTQYSMGGPIKYSLGSVDIVRRMQERGEPYLDYSCQIELYLPLIGVFSLDTQAVMGRTLEAEAILDPISGTLAAYAWVSKDGQKLPVAYGSTTISVDLPVTAQQYSVSKAALKQANAQLGTSLLSSVATLVAAAVGGGKAEGSNARVSGGASSMQGARGMNSYAQASSIAASQAAISQTGNVVGDFMQWGRTIKQLQYGNNTAISGSFGGSVAQWSYPFQAYVKINRPRYEKPENYAHTQGIPCVQKKRIGDCTGFIQCIGVDVDNHIEGATDLERQAIQAALSNGIYAGGGGS